MALMLVATVAMVGCEGPEIGSDDPGDSGSRSPASSAAQDGADPGPAASPEPAVDPAPGPINEAFPGLTTFRGNANR